MITQETKAEIAKMYSDKNNKTRDIVKQYGISYNRLSAIAKEFGIPPRKNRVTQKLSSALSATRALMLRVLYSARTAAPISVPRTKN